MQKERAQRGPFPLGPYRLRPMAAADLEAVFRIERQIYPFPWSLGNFRDSLQSGYDCWVCQEGPDIIGYAVVMPGYHEAHLLNLGVAKAWQGKGIGGQFLGFLVEQARQAAAEAVYLEVRVSNTPARRLYEKAGFNELHVRRNYYVALGGREDAIVMGLWL